MTIRSRPAALGGLAVLGLLAAPGVASAHLVVTGMGPLYDGVSHFGLSPEDILPVVALGLFAGLRGPPQTRAAALTLPAGWLLGGLAGLAGLTAPAVIMAASGALMLIASGGLLAANLRAGPAACAGAAGVIGLVCGLRDVSGVSFDAAHLASLLGMGVAAMVAFIIAGSLTLPLQRIWMIVAARVAGSWMAALGLLLAGWVVRYGARVG